MFSSVFADASAPSVRPPSNLCLERSSVQKGWHGLRLEIGHNQGCDVRSLQMKGLMIGMQITGQPITVETYEGGRWIPTTLPSHHLFIHPTGTPLNIRHDLWTRWAIAIVDHPLLAGKRGARPHTPGWSSNDEILSFLFRALIEQLCREKSEDHGDLALAQSMIDSVTLALHQHWPQDTSSKLGITPEMIANLRMWIAENLEHKICIRDMADRFSYSAAHFAREFRRASGVTPHGFLQDIRLSTALELGSQGLPLVEIADRCGFADQAHFSNAFKRRFGFSPSMLRKSLAS